MKTLRDVLVEMGPEILLDDGADNWDAINLLDALEEAGDEEYLYREVIVLPEGIAFVDRWGYAVTPPAYRFVGEGR